VEEQDGPITIDYTNKIKADSERRNLENDYRMRYRAVQEPIDEETLTNNLSSFSNNAPARKNQFQYQEMKSGSLVEESKIDASQTFQDS
jgi:hypothetical protein